MSGRLLPRPLDLGPPERRFEGADDAFGQPVLQVENVFEGALEFFGPDVRPRRRIDELAGDAHALAALRTLPSST